MMYSKVYGKIDEKVKNFNKELKFYKKEQNGYYRTERNQIKNSSNGFNSTHDSKEHITNEFKDRSIKLSKLKQFLKNCFRVI